MPGVWPDAGLVRAQDPLVGRGACMRLDRDLRYVPPPSGGSAGGQEQSCRPAGRIAAAAPPPGVALAPDGGVPARQSRPCTCPPNLGMTPQPRLRSAAPKGHNPSAQGSALGTGPRARIAGCWPATNPPLQRSIPEVLKIGWTTILAKDCPWARHHEVVPPRQGGKSCWLVPTQGAALGWRMSAFRAWSCAGFRPAFTLRVAVRSFLRSG